MGRLDFEDPAGAELDDAVLEGIAEGKSERIVRGRKEEIEKGSRKMKEAWSSSKATALRPIKLRSRRKENPQIEVS